MTKPLDKERLRKLLLVALSSDQPGEVMNAMVKIKKVLGLAGLDIHWLAGLIEAPPARSMPSPFEKTDKQDWLEQLLACVDTPQVLWRRESEFIWSLLSQHAEHTQNGESWQPSPKQRQWLADIYRKVSSTRSHTS